MTTEFTDIIARSLGSSTSYAVYSNTFDPTLLNPMPRSAARERWNITGEEFTGVDVWHCYEASFLLDNGSPLAGTLKFIYSAESEFMVESKSMKLYLNSFDMCKMGPDRYTAAENYSSQIKSDLEKILNTEVQVHFFDSIWFENYQAILYDPLEFSIDINTQIDISQVNIDDYQGTRNHIITSDKGVYAQSIYFNMLRSRCRHTKQKDTGTAIIEYTGKRIIPESLFKQIVSLREVDEFHEFCAEKLFIEIQKASKCIRLGVHLLYSRRGSLDINPVRVSDIDHLPSWASDVKMLSFKTQGQ